MSWTRKESDTTERLNWTDLNWTILCQWLRVQVLVVVQWLSCVRFFVIPCIAACHVSLSFTTSQSVLQLMSIESVTRSNHLVLCCLLLLPPSLFPSIRVFYNERQALCFRWPKYWSFNFRFLGRCICNWGMWRWDRLGPEIWDPYRVCTWPNISWNNKIQENYKWLKLCACEVGANYGQQDTRIPKTPTATLKIQEQKQGTVHAPAGNITKGVGKPPKPPLWPDPWTHTYPHPT